MKMNHTFHNSSCPHCGPGIIHSGVCPKVKEIEYFPDGRVKRIVFRTPADEFPAVQPSFPNWPYIPPVTFTEAPVTPGPGVTVLTRNAGAGGGRDWPVSLGGGGGLS